MSPFASDALVLRTYKLGETSKLVVLLTRERGKVRAVAKGARGPRSRQPAALEPLSEVRVSLYGRQGAEMFRLGQCELLRSAFPASGQGLDMTLAKSYFAELLEAFSQEGEAEDTVYRLATSVLRAAEEGTSSVALSRYLEAWLLKLHGVYPPLDTCAGCGGRLASGEPLWYHAGAHGFVCPRCGPASGPVLPVEAGATLRSAFRRPPSALAEEPPPAPELGPFHRDLITRHLERELRSYRVLENVARETRP
jgi:DNA repair protein RecO (recombination protein O)